MRIAIVGGGPAGSYLGYCLAKRGIKATIFDASHPREKPCGGGLSTFALRKFPILHELPSGKVEGKKILLVSPSGREVMIEGREEGWNVMRADLDAFLLERAVGAGTRLVKERAAVISKAGEWKIKTQKGVHKADILIGADGVNSVVRSSLLGPFRKEDLCFCYGYFTEVSDGLEDMEGIMKFYKDMMGYAWLFPRERDCSIGIGTSVEHSKKAKAELEAFRKKYAGDAKILGRWGALIPSGRTADFFRQHAAGDGWMLVGDAAGHVNPITGEGIPYALWSAELACEAIEAGDLPSYDRLWQAAYGQNLADGANARSSLYNRYGLDLSVWLSGRSRRFAEFMYDSINGEIPFRRFSWSFLKAFPRGILEACI